jgi:acetyltransferase-like isoleucine patch superfamily enzyme
MGISTLVTYFICFLKNIKIDKNNSFYGIPILVRRPLSTIKLGKNCIMRSDITTNLACKKRCIIRTYNQNALIEIGNNTGINGSVLAAAEKIIIGKDVLIGYNCYISDTDNHVINPLMRHSGMPETSPIYLNDNVWLGVNVVILKGVTIGKNSVIGANSLVLSNIPENVLAIGNPCRVIKKI